MEKSICLTSWPGITIFIPYAIGYLFAIIFGSILIRFVMDEIKEKTRFSNFRFTSDEKKINSWYAQVVGIFDFILYISAMLIDKYEFIAIWLAFKVAGRWEASRLEQYLFPKDIKRIFNEKGTNWGLIINNALYNTFTIGNALVIIWAGVSYKIINYLKNESYGKAIVIALLLILLTLIFYLLAIQQTKRLEKLENTKNTKNSNNSKQPIQPEP